MSSTSAARLAFNQRKEKALQAKRRASLGGESAKATSVVSGVPSTRHSDDKVRHQQTAPFKSVQGSIKESNDDLSPPPYSLPSDSQVVASVALSGSDATATQKEGVRGANALSGISKSRRNSLLEQARKEREDFLDGGQDSPQLGPQPHTSGTKLDGRQGAEGGVALLQSATTNNTEGGAYTSGISSGESEERASFLQTAQRLFSFLNRFSPEGADASAQLRLPDFNSSSSSSRLSAGVSSSDGTAGKGNDKGLISASRQPNRKKQFNYKAFKEKIKNPHAGDAFKTIKRFVVEFSRNARDSKEKLSRRAAGERMRQFLDEVERLMSANELWCHDDPLEWESTCEGLEKFVTSKLYEHIFCPREEDHKRDEKLHERISSLSFVGFNHLDIEGPETKEDFRLSWQLAMDELCKMNDYKAPRDKMICLLNSCKVIVRLLTDAREDADESPPGADEFLPALIYVVLKANPPNLFSNLDYIDCFRNPNKMISEPGYWYTNLYSAVTFLENVEHNSLSITEEEFAAGMASAKTQMEQAKKMARAAASTEELLLDRSPNEKNPASSLSKDIPQPSSSDNVVEKARFWVRCPPVKPGLPSMDKNDMVDQQMLAWKSLRYRFLAQKLSEIRVVDVGPLLQEYKNLATSCDQLLNERENLIKRVQGLEAKLNVSSKD